MRLALSWFALLTLAALVSCRGSQGVVGSLSHLAITPLAVDFGEVAPGTTAQQEVTIINDGTASVTISALAFVQTAGTGLSCTGCEARTLASQERMTVTVIFAPTSRRIATATVTVRSDAENAGEVVVRVAGNSRCMPESDSAFCTRLGRNCGTVSGEDNCDVARAVGCGSCASAAQCGSSNVCGCDGESDQALCTSNSRQCGSLTANDTCGAVRTVTSCGGCDASTERCAANGACECVAETNEALCTKAARVCGAFTTVDRCGATRMVGSCGSCTAGNGCSDEGQCGCAALSDAEVCAARSKTCGGLSTLDACGTPRVIASCGTCAGTNVTCGGGGTEGQCGCLGETNATLCAARMLACGAAMVTDRCGTMRSIASCGTCPVPAHSTPTCATGSCDFTCNPGYVRSGSACVTSCAGPAQTALPFAGGTGGGSDPYLICTAAQLQSVHSTATSGAYYQLLADIDLSNVAFAPLGTASARFTGSFGGGGFSISNWSFSAPTADDIAFFGNTGARVVNLKLVNVQVTGRDSVGAVANGSAVLSDIVVSGVITGRDFVGGISGSSGPGGYRLSSQAEVHGRSNVGGVLGSLSGGSLIDSVASGPVIATGDRVGGLVGTTGSESYVRLSRATGNVSGQNVVGGLVGDAKVGGRYSSIAQNFATGAVSGFTSVGGLVGDTDVPIFNSYASGAVTGTSNVGGLVGRASSFIAHSYSSGAVTGTSDVGGLVGLAQANPLVVAADSFWDVTRSGRATSALGSGKTTAELADASTFSKWNAYTIWNVGAAAPTFRSSPLACVSGSAGFSGGAGTTADPYLISQVSQLYNVRCNLVASFRLTSDLDFAGQPMVPTTNAEFGGVFDGNDKTLSNWVSYDDRAAGLFSSVGASGVVRNLTLNQVEVGGVLSVAPAVGSLQGGTLSRVRTNGVVRGLYDVGGLVGDVRAGTVTRSTCAASVTGARAIGGCVGGASASTISNNASVGSVTSSVAPAVYVGGFLGDLRGATISNCYSGAPVTVGAGFAMGNSGTVTGSYWDTQTSGQATSPYATGKTTSELKTQATFTGWDFTSLWDLQPGQYPSLR